MLVKVRGTVDEEPFGENSFMALGMAPTNCRSRRHFARRSAKGEGRPRDRAAHRTSRLIGLAGAVLKEAIRSCHPWAPRW
jgi:hypothetical protein